MICLFEVVVSRKNAPLGQGLQLRCSDMPMTSHRDGMAKCPVRAT